MAIHLDTESFALFQGGDTGIFNKVYYAFVDEIFAFCRKQLENHADAQDATAMTMTKFWQKKDTIKGPDTMRPFIYATAKHICLDMLKEKGRERKWIRPLEENDRLEETFTDPGPVTLLELVEAQVPGGLLKAIGEAMQGLSHQCKTAFHLRYIEFKSMEDIADIMNISTKTAYHHVEKARKDIGNSILHKGILLLLTIMLYLLFN